MPARGSPTSMTRTPSSTWRENRSRASVGRRRTRRESSTAASTRRAALVEAMQNAARPPSVFISGSAVGYYGPLGDEVVTEEQPPGSDFLAGVCVRWEAEAARAASSRTRVVCVRTGIVLERDGGALPQMLPPFWFGAGGPVGSGRQYWPWIHRADWINLVCWVLRSPAATGPINATAPAPVTNAEFARALGRALHRPAFMPAPAFALRLMLGEMADALLLSGQRARSRQGRAPRLRLHTHSRRRCVGGDLRDSVNRRRISRRHEAERSSVVPCVTS